MDLIDKIRTGDRVAFHELYSLYRNEFIIWSVRQYSCSEDEAKDIFQDIVIDFYKKINRAPNFELTCDLKTYLFSIGKFKLLNLIQKKQRISNHSDFSLINTSTEQNLVEMIHEEEYNREEIKKYLSKIPLDCRKILDLYYVQGWNMESIAKELNLSSINAAKKKKFDCMQKLAKLITNSTKILGIIAMFI